MDNNTHWSEFISYQCCLVVIMFYFAMYMSIRHFIIIRHYWVLVPVSNIIIIPDTNLYHILQYQYCSHKNLIPHSDNMVASRAGWYWKFSIMLASVSYQLIGRKINPIFSAVKLPYRTHSAVNTISTLRRIMRWHNIPTKQTDYVIIATSIILWEINYQNSHRL